jgi:predicted SAM-dependent methyltransferase
MKLVTAPSGHQLLLIYRTEFLFYTPERCKLAAEWNHVQLSSASLPKRSNLIKHRLDRPLPFADAAFDAIYSFHVVEHLSPRASERFVRDVYRMLKPGGICRISTPDLEFHAAEYLRCLRAQVAAESFENYVRYRWAVYNLIDQCTREVSGGEMLEAINRGELVSEHVKHMNGDLLRFLFPPSSPTSPPGPSPAREHDLTTSTISLRRVARAIKGRLGKLMPRKPYLELTHERNLWLFDRISLARLFSCARFRDITITDHRMSAIPSWNRYNFDESAFGSYPVEPSLYMEGAK